MMNFVRRTKNLNRKKKSELAVLFVNETDYPLACHDPLLQDGFSAPGPHEVLDKLELLGVRWPQKKESFVQNA